jgi:hypothetical protein
VASFVFLLDFGTVPTVWHYLFFYWTLEMFRQCNILFSLCDFGTDQRVWHYLVFYWTLELFRQCVIIDFSFFYWTLELFRQCGIIYFYMGLWNCSDSVALFVFLMVFDTVPRV